MKKEKPERPDKPGKSGFVRHIHPRKLSTMDFLINIHNADYRFDDAVRKWTHDMQFVSNYTPSHHRVVTGTIANPDIL